MTMKLYRILFDNEPSFIEAESFGDAVTLWRKVFEATEDCEAPEPESVELVHHEAAVRVDLPRRELARLVEVIDAAGLQNLSNGVQLGATSWLVEASEALKAARTALGVKLCECGEPAVDMGFCEKHVPF